MKQNSLAIRFLRLGVVSCLACATERCAMKRNGVGVCWSRSERWTEALRQAPPLLNDRQFVFAAQLLLLPYFLSPPPPVLFVRCLFFRLSAGDFRRQGAGCEWMAFMIVFHARSRCLAVGLFIRFFVCVCVCCCVKELAPPSSSGRVLRGSDDRKARDTLEKKQPVGGGGESRWIL